MKSIKKIINFLRVHTSLCSLLVVSIILLMYFAPVWREGKVPFNGNLLVSFFYPWKSEKFDGYPTGIPFKQGGGLDTTKIGYPYFGLVRSAWRNGEIPLWNPYNFSGLPLAAETQSAAYYPLQFLGIFLSQIDVWIVFSVSGFLFCFLFMYWYLYNLTDHKESSIFGAFTFSFSTFFIVWNQEVVTAIHSAMWMPLMMLSVDHLSKKIQTKWFMTLLISSVLCILAGYTQVSLYVFIFTAMYFCFRLLSAPSQIKEKIKFASIVVSAIGISMLLTLFQTLPLQEMYNLSSRSIVDIRDILSSYLLPHYSLIQLIIPDFFGNSGTWNHYGYGGGTFYEHSYSVSLVSIIFTLIALLSKDSRKEKAFFILMGLVSLSLALDTPVSRWIFTASIPLFSTSISNRILFIPAFIIAVLSALGLKYWHTKSIKDIVLNVFISITILSGLFIAIIVRVLQAKSHGDAFPYALGDWTSVALKNSIFPGFILATSLLLFLLPVISKKLKFLSFVLIFSLAIFQIGYFFQKVTAFSSRNFIYPKNQIFDYISEQNSLYRFWGIEDARIESNIASQIRLYSPEGYDSLADRRYSQLLKASEIDGLWTDSLSRSDVGIYKDRYDMFLKNQYRLRILDLTSTKYLLYKPKIEEVSNSNIVYKIESPKFKFLKEIQGTQIYEIDNILPRASLIGKKIIKSNGNEQEIFDSLFSQSFDPTKEIILEVNDHRKIKEDSEADAEIQTYTPNKVLVQTQSKTPQYLLLTDAYYPGWNVFIDGKSSMILRANFALRAVFVPEGKHTVEFQYFPNSFRYGLYLSFTTLCIVILLLLFTPFVLKKYKKL